MNLPARPGSSEPAFPDPSRQERHVKNVKKECPTS